jgi:hypothetical protein
MIARKFGYLAVILVLALSGWSDTTLAQEFTVEKDDVKGNEPDYSPYVDRNIPVRVFFGDTHHHTANSPDAGLIGNTLGPDMAYRFARGEEVTSSTGLRVKLNRPLDFLVVSDHAEYLGLPVMIRNGDPALLADPYGKRWYDMFQTGKDGAYDAVMEIIGSATKGVPLITTESVTRSVWERFTKTAEQFNDPGRFTAFIGFEWSSLPQARNLHRVVIFRDGADRANQVLPYSLFDSQDPEDLWKYLAGYEQKTSDRSSR